MNRSIFGLFFVLVILLSCKNAESNVVVRGKLIWTDTKQTIETCESKETLWVRVLVSNLHFNLGQKVKEIRASNATDNILVEFKGTVSHTKPSDSPGYPIDGVLTVSEISAAKVGRC